MVLRRQIQLQWIGLIVVLLACACIVAGCSSNTEQPPGSSSQPISTTQAAATTAARPAAGSVQAIDFNLLLPLLPNAPPGWTADEPQGMKMTVQEGTYSFATREYTSGDKRATVMIWDTAFYNVGGWEQWNSGYSMETTDGYWRSTTISGYPAWESYSKQSNDYGTWIGVAQRFSVMITVDGGSKADIDAFTGAINYQGIAALK